MTGIAFYPAGAYTTAAVPSQPLLRASIPIEVSADGTDTGIALLSLSNGYVSIELFDRAGTLMAQVYHELSEGEVLAKYASDIFSLPDGGRFSGTVVVRPYQSFHSEPTTGFAALVMRQGPWGMSQYPVAESWD